MSFTTSAGTTISLSAAAPATFNAAGYGVLSFTEVAEVTDLGDIPSQVFELVTHQPIKTRGVEKAKGGKNLGNQTIRFALSPDDAGQALLEDAADSDNVYSIKIAHPDIGTIYAQALVMNFTRTYGDVNSPSQGSSTLEYTYSTGGVGFVLVAA